jgi:hypothetical protein
MELSLSTTVTSLQDTHLSANSHVQTGNCTDRAMEASPVEDSTPGSRRLYSPKIMRQNIHIFAEKPAGHRRHVEKIL